MPLSLRSSTRRSDCSIILVHVWTEWVETAPHCRGQPQELHWEDLSQGLVLQDLRFTRTGAAAWGRTDAKLQCPGASQPCRRVGGKSPTKLCSPGSRAQALPLLVQSPGDPKQKTWRCSASPPLPITCPASRTQGREDRLPRASICMVHHPHLWTYVLSRYQPG